MGFGVRGYWNRRPPRRASPPRPLPTKNEVPCTGVSKAENGVALDGVALDGVALDDTRITFC